MGWLTTSRQLAVCWLGITAINSCVKKFAEVLRPSLYLAGVFVAWIVGVVVVCEHEQKSLNWRTSPNTTTGYQARKVRSHETHNQPTAP